MNHALIRSSFRFNWQSSNGRILKANRLSAGNRKWVEGMGDGPESRSGRLPNRTLPLRYPKRYLKSLGGWKVPLLFSPSRSFPNLYTLVPYTHTGMSTIHTDTDGVHHASMEYCIYLVSWNELTSTYLSYYPRSIRYKAHLPRYITDVTWLSRGFVHLKHRRGIPHA